MLSMIPVVIRNLFGRIATRPYPRHPRPPFAGARGQLENDAEKCLLCGTCARVCPSQCLTVRKKEGLWEYEPFACVFCGVCVESCPAGSLAQLGRWRPAVRERERVVLKVEVKSAEERQKA